MKLYGIRFGENFKYGTNGSVFLHAAQPDKLIKNFSFFFYLAQHEDKNILIDTGFHDTKLADTMGVKLLPIEQEMQNVFGSTLTIDTIILTHSHWDHIGNIPAFPNADIFLSDKTFDSIMQNGTEHEKNRLLCSNVHTVKLPHRIYDTFELVYIGGHTEDSCAILFADGEQNYAITGDECYLCENAERELPIGISVSQEKNRAFLRKLKEEARTPLPFHDGGLLTKYKQLSENIIEIIG